MIIEVKTEVEVKVPSQVSTTPTSTTTEPKLVQYAWFDSVPDGLKTKTQLRQMRLVPTGKPKGYVYWKRKRETYYLYDETETRPIREATAKQKEALAKARRKRFTCPKCDTYYGSRYELTGWGGICHDCERKLERRVVVEWAHKLLSSEPEQFCIIDTETTGLKQPDICSIAVVSGTGEVLFDTLVKPNVPVEPGARAVHGIKDAQLADAPGWATVYPKLRRMCRGRKLIMYKAAFDLRAMKTACELAGVQWKGFGRSGECLMEMYAQFVGDWSEYHESYRYQPLPGGDHTALGDCRAALKLVTDLAQLHGHVVDPQLQQQTEQAQQPEQD
jgi:DNA polymerase III subunit epsilon